MGQERSYTLLLNQHDKASCRTQMAARQAAQAEEEPTQSA